jgi:hypothetical protein
VASLVQATLAITFLIVWANPASTDVGVWERVVSFVQAAYLSAVVIWCAMAQRRVLRSAV